MNSSLHFLVSRQLGATRTGQLFADMQVHPALIRDGAEVSRAELAQALNMVLFADLLDRVPEGAAYAADASRIGRKIVFDHGALRTVAADNGALPVGHLAFDRILAPLGFTVAGLYPLPRLKMTGRAYAHADFPEDIAQFFVSELHVDQFSDEFQQAVSRVTGNSTDPLSTDSVTLLAELAAGKTLSREQAARLLANLVSCFACQHATVTRADYQILLAESAEMAWISTEGNAYNHVTDRVADVFALSDEQRALGRSIKDNVEVSANGRVRQTAYKAAQIQRPMREADGSVQLCTVPGSFYEFITRDAYVNEQGERVLDLTFDSSNATGIFKMTAAATRAA